MDLEDKVHKKTNIFKKISKKVMPLVLAASLGISAMGCFRESPGPISVENTVSPKSVLSGDYIDWEVNVTNFGSEVTIDRVILNEKVVSGWATGIYDFTGDVPITNTEIYYGKETIISLSVPVYNTGPDTIVFENTITVKSNGGEDSDTCRYAVLSSLYEYPEIKDKAVKGLSGSLK